MAGGGGLHFESAHWHSISKIYISLYSSTEEQVTIFVQSRYINDQNSQNSFTGRFIYFASGGDPKFVAAMFIMLCESFFVASFFSDASHLLISGQVKVSDSSRFWQRGQYLWNAESDGIG